MARYNPAILLTPPFNPNDPDNEKRWLRIAQGIGPLPAQAERTTMIGADGGERRGAIGRGCSGNNGHIPSEVMGWESAGADLQTVSATNFQD